MGRRSESWPAVVVLNRRRSNNWWLPASVPVVTRADSEMPTSPPAVDGSCLVLLRYCSRLLLDRRTIVKEESSGKEKGEENLLLFNFSCLYPQIAPTYKTYTDHCLYLFSC